MQRGGPLRKLLIALLGIAVPACQESRKEADVPLVAGEEAPCGDRAIIEQVRRSIIGQAQRLRRSDADAIARIGQAAQLQLRDARMAGRDPALSLTLCRARVMMELPEGEVDAFDGGRQLAADLRYAVQRGANRAWLLHPLEGVEPLAYRLATVPMRASRDQPAARPQPPATAPAQNRIVEARRPPELAPATRAPPPPRRGLPEPALTSSGRPSFDCRRARSRVERMICGDERLAALDRVTLSLYNRRLDRAGSRTRARLRQSQEQFLQRRDDCRRAGCVADRYRARLDEIDLLVGR